MASTIDKNILAHCPYIGCEFKDRWPCRVKKHSRSSHGDPLEILQPYMETYSCAQPACTFSTWCDTYLRHHMKNVHQFGCPLCPTKFPQENKLVSHLRTHLDERPFPCSQCNYGAKTRPAIKKHFLLSHTETKTFSCRYPGCTFRAKVVEGLKKHEIIHDLTRSREFQCDLCLKKFFQKRSMERHLVRHEKWKNLVCYMCGFEAKTSWHLRNHLNIHEKKHLVCSVPNCNYRTENAGHLQRHEGSHEDKKFYNLPCPICSKLFHAKANLREHLKRHDPEVPYKCEQCSFATKYCGNLAAHVKNVHEKVKLKHCPVQGCNFQSCYKIEMRKHHLTVHEGPKPYACFFPGCTYRGRMMRCLVSHSKQHSDPNSWNFPCPFCDKRFAAQVNMEVHVRRHIRERPYKCKCGSGFIESSELRRHERAMHSKQRA